MSSNANNGFIDLRVGNNAGGVGDDSIWPSFTDIMTVIVMIFLMALVIMMARNFELDRQLITTEISREQGLAENISLQNKIRVLESGMAGLRESLGSSESARERLQLQLLNELRRIELMLADNHSLEDQLAAIIAERDKLSREKQAQAAQSAARIAALTDSEATLSARVTELTTKFGDFELQSAEANAEIERLTRAINQRRLENAALQDLADASGARFRSLQEEYESLDEKYRELARPARTSAGKYVVSVWILSAGSDDDVRFRLQETSGEPEDYNRAELNQRLTGLKEKHGTNLYTKIIIPETSNLSHNQAWEFTQEILREYDYYHQQQ